MRMKFSIKSLTQVLAFTSIIDAAVGAEIQDNGCSIRVGERDNNDVRHRRMVSVNLPKRRCANSDVVTIDIPHNHIKRSFKSNPAIMSMNARGVKNANDPDYWYGEDSTDGSSFNYVQDKDGNIAGSMVDLTNDTVMQFHIENDEPTVIITKSSDFRPGLGVDPKDLLDVDDEGDRKRNLMTDSASLAGLSDEDITEEMQNVKKVPDTIKYGNIIHLQNNWIDNRWLTGCRTKGNTKVSTQDKLGSTKESVTFARTYEWIVRSVAGNGNRTYTDPRNGQCLKYGDKIYLQNNFRDYRWLTGSRGSDNAIVKTKNKLGSTSEYVILAPTYEWIVRSVAGNGTTTYTDPKNGQCVNVLDNINLQNNFMDLRWLTGSRNSRNTKVHARNILRSIYESIWVPTTYQWFVRLDAGDGTRP